VTRTFSVATFFTQVLASHGSVVAAPDHPGDTIVDSVLGTGGTDDTAMVANRVGDLQRVISAMTVPGPSTPPAISATVDPR
jgi:predicted dienelactone hydrolase